MVCWTVAPRSLCAGYQSFGELVTSVFRVKTSRVQTVIYIYIYIYTRGKFVNFFRRRRQGNRRRVPPQCARSHFPVPNHCYRQRWRIFFFAFLCSRWGGNIVSMRGPFVSSHFLSIFPIGSNLALFPSSYVEFLSSLFMKTAKFLT
jgi:hypothetical protein